MLLWHSIDNEDRTTCSVHAWVTLFESGCFLVPDADALSFQFAGGLARGIYRYSNFCIQPSSFCLPQVPPLPSPLLPPREERESRLWGSTSSISSVILVCSALEAGLILGHGHARDQDQEHEQEHEASCSNRGPESSIDEARLPHSRRSGFSFRVVVTTWPKPCTDRHPIMHL